MATFGNTTCNALLAAQRYVFVFELPIRALGHLQRIYDCYDGFFCSVRVVFILKKRQQQLKNVIKIVPFKNKSLYL